jgi:hypothetical protein
MKIIDSKTLDNVNTKYQAKFPNLANSDDLLTEKLEPAIFFAFCICIFIPQE